MKEMIRKFNAVIRFNWQSDLEYRSYFLFWALIESLPFLIMFFLWKFIYSNQSIVGGYNLSQIITYYFLVYVIDRITTTYIEWHIAGRIKEGMFAQFLYRPLPHRIYYLAHSTSQRILRTLVAVPVFLLGLAFFGGYLELASMSNLLLFLLALPIAWFLNYYLAILTGYFAFWMEKADSAIFFRWSLTYYLSGQFLPLSFYGEKVVWLLSLLPFRYAFGFPIDLYLGRLTHGEIYFGFAMGILWIVIMVIGERLMYARGIKRFKAIGN
jgi:ABC-2 type transport system permease protein